MKFDLLFIRNKRFHPFNMERVTFEEVKEKHFGWFKKLNDFHYHKMVPSLDLLPEDALNALFRSQVIIDGLYIDEDNDSTWSYAMKTYFPHFWYFSYIYFPGDTVEKQVFRWFVDYIRCYRCYIGDIKTSSGTGHITRLNYDQMGDEQQQFIQYWHANKKHLCPEEVVACLDGGWGNYNYNYNYTTH